MPLRLLSTSNISMSDVSEVFMPLLKLLWMRFSFTIYLWKSSNVNIVIYLDILQQISLRTDVNLSCDCGNHCCLLFTFYQCEPFKNSTGHPPTCMGFYRKICLMRWTNSTSVGCNFKVLKYWETWQNEKGGVEKEAVNNASYPSLSWQVNTSP